MRKLSNRRCAVVIAPLCAALACGLGSSKNGGRDCGAHLYWYSSPGGTWSICLPIVSDLRIDSAPPGQIGGVPMEIQGNHPLKTLEADDAHWKRLLEWEERNDGSPEPVNPGDTLVNMRAFDVDYDLFDIAEALGPENVPTIESVAEGLLHELRRDERPPEAILRECRVTQLVNSHGKPLARGMTRVSFPWPGKGWITEIRVEVRNATADGYFVFRGVIGRSDTLCTLDCMEQDSTVLMFDRMVDSVDW